MRGIFIPTHAANRDKCIPHQWTGTKNPASLDSYIGVDAFEVVGLPGSGNVATGIWSQATCLPVFLTIGTGRKPSRL